MMGGRLPTEFQVLWLLGICLSIIGLIFQIVIYVLIPNSRKLDQKLLTQLTVARILNATFEYVVTNMILTKTSICNVFYSIYFQTDAALICCMFVFTKNLYDKIVKVFMSETNFTIASVSIWTVTFPIGLMCPLLMYLDPGLVYCGYFYKSFASFKFIVLSVNMLLFCRILKEVISKKEKNLRILRTCAVSFILLSLSGAQAQAQMFLVYLIPSFLGDNPNSTTLVTFGVINSYHVIAITTIFWFLVDKSCDNTLTQTIVKKIVKETV